MFCRFFILRPVLSIVISLIVLIAGGVAIWASPIAQYPDITPPSIKVTATFPGANAQTLADTVAAPLEDQISGVSDMIYMVSSSANFSNTVTITIYFDIGTDLRPALGDVLNRINTAIRQMPTQVQQQGITVRESSPDLFLMLAMYTQGGYPDDVFLSNYAYKYVYPIMNQVEGVGSVTLVGNRNFSMRIWLDPKKLAYYNISASDVVAAIQDQNSPYVVGVMGMPPSNGSSQFQFMITTQGYLNSVKQFENIIVKANQNANGTNQIIKVKDLGKVSLDGQQYLTDVRILQKDANGKLKPKNIVAMLFYLSPGANQLATRDRIERAMDEVASHFPAGIKYYYHYDASVFVKASIKQVLDTFRDAFILVFIVVFLFIQNLRGTIIPVLAIPVSIIGTFAGTYALGFSINTLTLFGVVLAIGIVVDDAIVVLENVERLMSEENLSPQQAAIKAMEEVASPVIAIVLVLNAVFLPVAFLGGFTGLLFKQFAVTIAVSVFLSGVVALTLTPTLCSLLLKNTNAEQHTKKKFKFFEKFDYYFFKLRDKYIDIVKYLIHHAKVGYTIFGVVVLLTVVLYKIIPTSLIPLEDMGYFYTSILLPGASSIDRTSIAADRYLKFLSSWPQTAKVLSVVGLDILDNSAIKTNAAFAVPVLKSWDERKSPKSGVDALINQANMYGYMDKGARFLSFNSPPIRGLSQSGGVNFYLEAATDVSTPEIYADSVKLVQALMKYPAVQYAAQFYDISVPQLYLDVDREKAKLYGVDVSAIFNALQASFGTLYVNFFERWSDVWWVILQSSFNERNTPELLKTVYVKNKTGQMIPVGSLASVSFITGAEVVTRFNDYPASQMLVNPKSGYTSGEVMQAISDATPKVLGKKYIVKWFGASYQENLAGSSSAIALTLGIIMVFLILAALYELWGLPLSVILAAPFALLGAALMLLMTRRPNDIYFQVSLITLIGLSAKNAILIVEFALDAYRKEGKDPVDAAIEGAKLRFRPIVMTSLAFILGALPLALAHGAGANSQHSVGTGIIGGMLGSTLFATLFVPLFFVTFIKLSKSKTVKEK